MQTRSKTTTNQSSSSSSYDAPQAGDKRKEVNDNKLEKNKKAKKAKVAAVISEIEEDEIEIEIEETFADPTIDMTFKMLFGKE